MYSIGTSMLNITKSLTIVNMMYSLCLLDPVKVDHQRANRQRIKEIGLKSIERQKESSQPENPVPPRTDKYSHVTSKVTAFMIVSCVNSG